MAGSYRHISHKIEGKSQFLGTTLIDNLGDAHEALEECWFMIQYLAEGNEHTVRNALDEFYKPTTELASELQMRLKKAEENSYWDGELDDLPEDEY